MKKTIIVSNLIGNKLNIFVNGQYHTKEFDSKEEAMELFQLCQKAKKDEEFVEELLAELSATRKILVHGFLEKDNNNNFYLKGTSEPIPVLLLETMLSYVENKYPLEGLINFWKLCLLNPNKESRYDLFKFLSTYNFSITDSGMFISYKAVTHKDKVDDDLIDFISNQWLKIKRWKKSPKNYSVVIAIEEIENSLEHEEYDEETDEINYFEETIYEERLVRKIIENTSIETENIKEVVGNLDELYKSIGDMIEKGEVESTLYTDKHTQKMDIKIGKVVSMERNDCDSNKMTECSYGLHVGSIKYVESFAGREDTVLVCLVNPMNVIAVPQYDNSKMRVCEYFPFAKVERKGKGEFEIIEAEYFEDDYINIEKETLEKMIEEMFEGNNPIGFDEDEKIKEKVQIMQERLKSIY